MRINLDDLNSLYRFELLGKTRLDGYFAPKEPSDTTHIYDKDGVRYFLMEKPPRKVTPEVLDNVHPAIDDFDRAEMEAGCEIAPPYLHGRCVK